MHQAAVNGDLLGDSPARPPVQARGMVHLRANELGQSFPEGGKPPTGILMRGVNAGVASGTLRRARNRTLRATRIRVGMSTAIKTWLAYPLPTCSSLRKRLRFHGESATVMDWGQHPVTKGRSNTCPGGFISSTRIALGAAEGGGPPARPRTAGSAKAVAKRSAATTRETGLGHFYGGGVVEKGF